MKLVHTYRQSGSMILLLVLWCTSIFGSAIITCCLGWLKNTVEYSQQEVVKLKIDRSNTHIQWINETEVRVDNVLYDVVSGGKNDKIISVKSDLKEQNAISYISELNKESSSGKAPVKPKQENPLPDLFFEGDTGVIICCLAINNNYLEYNKKILSGFVQIKLEPPELSNI